MGTTNLLFDEWTEVFGPERLTGALLDRLNRHVRTPEMNGDSYRLKHSRENAASQAPDDPEEEQGAPSTLSLPAPATSPPRPDYTRQSSLQWYTITPPQLSNISALLTPWA